ncbi:aminotransferase class I/II-fold pyridoxal phosphate-dependent enzyme [Fimbriimonas ginsengisoli]|uniref:Histidinol-phosphate aminotransferase n=1 Tax=Fimbriimonas ginsengisoli Gsoil 348 TaxID=661478 RepID=A0A068NQK2_FIMGI|nr:aminotransferase class I/II-fold pyridoxal phosphate-dependent enzyme [Fimbriimonas ginsengisoli]AIE85706.1 Histidinol-phosphate aminotransferase [Fimbriimonas ginsengisoli Gsoil 348]
MPIPSALVASLPSTAPFLGPETLERQLGRKFTLRLGANESPFGPSPRAIEAMVAQAAQGQNYSQPDGWDLRAAIAAHHGVRVEEVMVGTGIDDLLALLCRAYCDPGDFVVTTLGSYPTLEYGALGAGAQIARVSYRNDAVDLAALLAEVLRTDARIVYVANPDNPSGSLLTSKELSDFRAQLPERTLLLMDEAYADFTNDLPPIDTSDASVVRVRTFSKGYGMAGLRVGYAVGHVEMVGLIDRIRMHFGVNSVAAAGAIASLEDPEFLRFVVQQADLGRVKMEALAESLGLRALPSHTNFVLVDFGTKDRAVSAMKALLEAGIFVRKPGQPPLDRGVRITIPRLEDFDLFAEKLTTVCQSLQA